MRKTANLNDIYDLKPYGFILPLKATTLPVPGLQGLLKRVTGTPFETTRNMNLRFPGSERITSNVPISLVIFPCNRLIQHALGQGHSLDSKSTR
jgi:hypothetical protein